MKHFYYGDVPLVDIGAGAQGAKRRWLVDQESGAAVSMMFVEVKPGGNTLRHAHPYEHTMFFLEGTGEVVDETGVSPIGPLEVIYIEPNELHQIRNTGAKTLKFIAVEPAQRKA
jgi:mannose-6-phosphate isomerase-like protein (cupin superfamily)